MNRILRHAIPNGLTSLRLLLGIAFPFLSGEWRLWASANGNWFEIKGLGDVDNGNVIKINRQVELIMPPSGLLRIQTTGWEDDCDSHFGVKRDTTFGKASSIMAVINDNDQIGNFTRTYSAGSNFGARPQPYDEAITDRYRGCFVTV